MPSGAVADFDSGAISFLSINRVSGGSTLIKIVIFLDVGSACTLPEEIKSVRLSITSSFSQFVLALISNSPASYSVLRPNHAIRRFYADI